MLESEVGIRLFSGVKKNGDSFQFLSIYPFPFKIIVNQTLILQLPIECWIHSNIKSAYILHVTKFKSKSLAVPNYVVLQHIY